MLITNGLSFAIQAVLFLIVGSFADYGTWRPHITTAFTFLAWGVSFGWLGVTSPSKWQAGTALYILGLIGYQGALTFWTAAFPGLARDLPEIQESEEELRAGTIDQATHDKRDMLARNRLANVSFFVCSVGELVILAILCGILAGVVGRASDPNNSMAFSIVCAYSAAAWSEYTAWEDTWLIHESRLCHPVVHVGAIPARPQAASAHVVCDRWCQTAVSRLSSLPQTQADVHLPGE